LGSFKASAKVNIYQLLFITSNSQISQLNKLVNRKKSSQVVKWVLDRLCAVIAILVFSLIILTVLKVAKRDGINQEGCATASDFMGVLDVQN
jgi:lipopolysaccharide/colanic/teichoic acid biosynthesis glycosyltransferase